MLHYSPRDDKEKPQRTTRGEKRVSAALEVWTAEGEKKEGHKCPTIDAESPSGPPENARSCQ
eukprot:15260646-Alexandrium_andersonii.AAC.1